MSVCAINATNNDSVAEVPATTQSESAASQLEGHNHGVGLKAMTMGALGVVYGDIATSPLYSLREALHTTGLVVSPENVLGMVATILWSLFLIVCVKYVLLMMRADHHGEGGILALTALVAETPCSKTRKFPWLLVLGLFGTALLYGDGIITPAVSVLSAVEGLELITPAFQPYVAPITLVILIFLFALQYKGTDSVSKLFAPVMLVWFFTVGLLGFYRLCYVPEMLAAFNPWYSIKFFMHNGLVGFVVLGSVFLALTGGEALYADMGHFGRKPIQLGWFFVVLPSLILNYLGQGAVILSNPEALENPFFRLAPNWALYPVVLLATMATIIASQSLISAAFSLTAQAIQLGYLPRMKILHTSDLQKGQIYVPFVNWILMIACLILVVSFRTSSNLAAAYGVAVTGTMLATTILFGMLLVYGWKWSKTKAFIICGFFISIESIFFCSNMAKVFKGGWIPLIMGVLIYVLMSTWKAGRTALFQLLQKRALPLKQFLERLPEEDIYRFKGVGIFMYGNPTGTPPALLANLSHNHALPDKVIVLAVEITGQAYVPQAQRVETITLGQGFYRVRLRFGFREKPDVLPPLATIALDGEQLRPEQASFFMGRETVIPRQGGIMAYWREELFATMNKNAMNATLFFNIPADCVVELGTQLEI